MDRPDWLTIEAADLPDDVFALLDHHLLDLGGTYGEPEAGEPIQYDELRIEHDQGDVEICVYNRAILLFMTGRPGPAWCSGSPCPARFSDVVGNWPFGGNPRRHAEAATAAARRDGARWLRCPSSAAG